ncbi:MAG: DMT family transporter [Alphaproteobacteria bacterium]|nr:DMT family transporter [Alphaproteobacteria bacterium]
METRNELMGIILVLVIGVCFAMANTLAGLAYTGGTDALSVSTSRFMLPALILVVILVLQRKSILLPTRDGLISIVLGLVTVGYTWALLSAIEILAVPLVVLIFYLFPLITSFIVAAMGWEQLRKINIVAAFVAFGGLALALGTQAGGLNILGVVYSVIAAFGLATVSAVSKRVIRTGDPRQATFYMATTAMVVFLVITFAAGEFRLPETGPGWWGFIGTNVFYAVAMIGYFAAIGMIGPAKTTLYSNIEPVLAIGAAWVLLDQTLSPIQFVGVLIVLGALVAVARVALRAGRVPTGPAAPGSSDRASP